MSRSLIQTVNQSTQNVVTNGDISFGSVIRRYGPDLRLSGNGIELIGDGYFVIDAIVVVAPTTAGEVTVSLLDNGTPIPGATVTGYATTANTPVIIPFVATVRHKCCYDAISSLTAVLVEGAGSVTLTSARVMKS